MVCDKELMEDLILLELDEFDVILGMDWLVAYHASVYCYTKEVVFRMLGQPEFSFQGDMKDSFPCLIYAI